MLRRKLFILSALLVLGWAVGMFVFHTTLGGYLHLLLLLAANSALFCIAREEKSKSEPEQVSYPQEQTH